MNRACQHYKIRDVVDDYVIALCWANFRLRLPLKTASRQSPADRRAHPGQHETHPPIAGPDIGKGKGPRTNGNLYTVSRLLAEVARLLAHHASL